jgi:uncharacterized protein YukE
MNYADYINQSKNYAQNAQNEYEQSLSYLISGLDETKALDQEAANVRYQNLINQIRQQIPEIQDTFARNAKAAYINKQQNLQQSDADLNRLGVNTQGFGVTQRLLNETAYGANYNDLVLGLNKDLRDIANQETNASGKLNEDLADINANYAKDKLETQKYISEQGRDIYNQEYNNYYKNLQYQDAMKQQELENQRAEQERKDKLQQQAWENAFKEKQYADSFAQQQFENQLAQKEYELKVKQVNASISASSRSKSRSSRDNTSSDPVVNTNYCVYLGSKSEKAQSEYDALLTTISNQGGIKTSVLNEYLAQGKANGIFTTDDVSKIKKQFGIK